MIKTEFNEGIFSITLARPEKANAFDGKMIKDLTEAFASKDIDRPDCSLVLLSAQGKHFSAGADLNWMKAGVDLSPEDNREEALRLFDLFAQVFQCPKPTIAHAFGACRGGALGLLAASDVVLAQRNVSFALSEVKLGLVPAVIGPFLVEKIGTSQFLSLSVTGTEFDVDRALAMGLVNAEVSDRDHALDWTSRMLSNGCEAMVSAKQWARSLGTGSVLDPSVRARAADLISGIRCGKEAQERLKTFFDQRKSQGKET